MTTLELAPQQTEAVTKAVDWWNSDNQVFRLFGYAGTGKTTIARHIVDHLGTTATTLYAAFTGKAAYVLRTKGCDSASTIHGLIYMPKDKLRAHLAELQAKLDETTDPTERDLLQRQIRIEEFKLDAPDWILREPEDCQLSEADLLVVDEVSMVGQTMAADLLSFGTKVLVLGDPAQLPPVDGGGYFIDAQPDHLLTEIHRSALDSPVTRLATAVRNSADGDSRYGVAGPDGDSGRVHRMSVADLLAFDQVLVGRNATRWAANHLLRALRGLASPLPVAGDRIIILANSSEAEVFNGQQFTVVGSEPVDGRDDQLVLQVRDDLDKPRELTAWRYGFEDIEGERRAKRDGRGSVVAATYGQAITCHKSQGSQWDNVLVVDESNVFQRAAYREHLRTRNTGHASAEQAGYLNGRRWLYTAITRAAERVVIVPTLNGLLG